MGSNLEKCYDRTEYLKTICVSERIENPKVSIIVPTYNNAEFLEKCLFSLIKQTLKEIEIIIVNDASTDNTSSILNWFSTYDKRIKVLNHDKNKKQGAARNTGTNVAVGEYVGYVDSDDWVDLDYFEKLYYTAKKHESDIALATNVRIGHGKTKYRLNLTEEKLYTSLQDKCDIQHQAKNPCPTNKIYRRTMLEENNIMWPEGVYCEDKLFTIQAVYYANSIVTVPNTFYYYFRNPHSTVNSRKILLIQDKESAKRAVLDFLKSKEAQLRDCDFWAIKSEKRFLNIPIFKIIESLRTERLYILGLPVVSFQNLNNYDYKRKKVTIFGIKFTYKNPKWLKEASEYNLIQNQKNLSYESKTGKNILFIASYFVESGGIETRLLQYINQLQNNGWNVYLLSENNLNKNLQAFNNFYLNFDAKNVQKCLEEIIANYNIQCVEFQFKPSKVLKNFDIKRLKQKVKLGCSIHNIGVKDADKINQFDYSIMVSGQMYVHHYKNIKNQIIIKNGIDVSKFQNISKWQYNNQKTAILVSRIGVDKLESIECFIKYCKKNNIPFVIAGEEQYKNILKNKLIKKYKLNENIFIGQINTVEFLKQNMDKYLFVSGVGQVILEAGMLGYPVFVSSSYKNNCYSFVTDDNFELFDNFTIKDYSPVNKKKKKVSKLNLDKIKFYDVIDKLTKERNIDSCIQQYIKTIEVKYEK